MSLSILDSRFDLVADWRFLAAFSFLLSGLPPIFSQYSCKRSFAPLTTIRDVRTNQKYLSHARFSSVSHVLSLFFSYPFHLMRYRTSCWASVSRWGGLSPKNTDSYIFEIRTVFKNLLDNESISNQLGLTIRRHSRLHFLVVFVTFFVLIFVFVVISFHIILGFGG